MADHLTEFQKLDIKTEVIGNIPNQAYHLTIPNNDANWKVQTSRQLNVIYANDHFFIIKLDAQWILFYT